MYLPWYRKLLLPKTLLLLSIIVWIEAGWLAWMVQNNFANFIVAEHIREGVRRIDDVLNVPYTLDKEITGTFDELITILPPEDYLLNILSKWTYKADWSFWDAATIPVRTAIRQYGDCDDYARLSAHVLHRGGYGEVYFVAIGASDMGHAVAVYFSPADNSYVMADINGWSTLAVLEKKFPEDIHRLVQRQYPTTRFIAIRSWDLKTQLTIKEVRKRDEPKVTVD